jgi:hypothetical protein
MGSNTPMHRYGWLEQDEGMWHFVTRLFADPAESGRLWIDSQSALEELRQEGWTIISPYPDGACGYGLIWNSELMDGFRLTADNSNLQLPMLNYNS